MIEYTAMVGFMVDFSWGFYMMIEYHDVEYTRKYSRIIY